MGFSEKELLIIKTALRFYDEHMVCFENIDSIVDKVDFWLALERQDNSYELDDNYFDSIIL